MGNVNGTGLKFFFKIRETLVSWCDKLASRPTLGLSFNKHFRPSSELLSAVVPLLDELAGRLSDKFTLTKQDPFSVEFITESGFKYNIDPARISVEFQHRLKLVNMSGGMPTTQMLSKAEPYTHMLIEVGKRAAAAAELLITQPNRVLERIGVVSTTMVNDDDAPPGIRRGIGYLSRPWSGVESYHFQATASIARTDEWEDRCIHSLSKPETDDDEKLVTMMFDYQRKLTSKKGMSSVKSSIAAAQEAALRYFEDLAQGDMFDANGDATIE